MAASAAAAAKSLQMCPTLPFQRQQPTSLPRPWDSPGKNTGVGCPFLLQCMKVKNESEVTQSCPTPSDPMDCSLQAPPPMGFFRQEHWSGLPLPSGTMDCFQIGKGVRPDYILLPCLFNLYAEYIM